MAIKITGSAQKYRVGRVSRNTGIFFGLILYTLYTDLLKRMVATRLKLSILNQYLRPRASSCSKISLSTCSGVAPLRFMAVNQNCLKLRLRQGDQTNEPNLSPTRSLIWTSDTFLTADRAGHLKSTWIRSSESSLHNGQVSSIRTG